MVRNAASPGDLNVIAYLEGPRRERNRDTLSRGARMAGFVNPVADPESDEMLCLEEVGLRYSGFVLYCEDVGSGMHVEMRVFVMLDFDDADAEAEVADEVDADKIEAGLRRLLQSGFFNETMERLGIEIIDTSDWTTIDLETCWKDTVPPATRIVRRLRL